MSIMSEDKYRSVLSVKLTGTIAFIIHQIVFVTNRESHSHIPKFKDVRANPFLCIHVMHARALSN